ncbi:MAG: AAA family ATPase [Myxococcota bacterium]|nr:AAA family ATPase [Myxococcota bacterium]
MAHVYLVGYGAHRQSIEHMIELDKTGADATLFSPDAGLIDAQAWLLQLDYAAKSNPLFQAQLDQVKQTLLSVLPDVSDVRIVGPGARDAKATATPSSALVECETPYGWVPMDQLSLGYQSTLTWVVDLVARMYHRYPESENPLAEPVVVLIDELDLHLHPRWQREVIGYLSARFPKAQFIATAHSPLVVQAAEGANIAVFRREGDHVVIDQDHQNIRGWRVDQLLTSDLFGLESARSPEVAAQRARRIELLNTPQRSPAQEAELAKLREALSALPTESTPEKQRALDLLTQALGHLKAGP